MAIHHYPLINKMVVSLNLRDKLMVVGGGSTDLTFKRPFVTVAREPGSGGAPIAQRVAQKLGFTFIDEQIIDEIALSTKKRKEIIKAIDEKSRSALQDMVHSLLNSDYVDDVKYVTELVKVVLTYAHQGHAVILGRGANFITPFSQGLHVNVTAPYKTRVARAMKYEGLNERQAKDVIAKTELERKQFVKQYLKKDPSKCNSYDLTLNTAYLDVERASDIVVEAFYQKFSRVTRYSALFQS